MLRTNLEIVKGDILELELKITDDNNNPVDLTNTTIYFTVKDNIYTSDSKALIKITQNNHINPQQGITSIYLSSSQTNLLLPNKIYFYDIRYKKDDVIITLCRGEIKIVTPITVDV